MRSVIVYNSEGNCVVDIPVDRASEIAAIVEKVDSPQEKHKQICDLLALQRFYPSPSHRPYAIKATFIEVSDGHRIVAAYGKWHECYKCHKNIDKKPSGTSCPNCGTGAIPNIRIGPELFGRTRPLKT